ncbi:MAG: SMP-30/gluconolactonase/LRE family protein [Solirubrobacterales bacterium]|nr:SMP-30/gluconolactonase/LRE family protein [Solirubrobacterales bacterium]
MTRSLRLFTSIVLVGMLALVASTASASAAGLLGGVNLVGGGPSDTTYQLSYPGSIARVGDGSFFVIDSGNSRIVRLDSTGKFLYAFGGPSSSDSGTQLATSLALVGGGANPDLIVANAFGTIKRFTSGGTFVSKFSLPTTSSGYVAVDPSCGELYVSETQSNRVQRFALEDNGLTVPTEQFGDLLETFGQGSGLVADYLVEGKLWGPREVALDSTGRVFVADSNQRRVSVFKWTGNCGSRTHAYETKFGNNSSGSPELMQAPQALAIDRSVLPNKIYVSQVYLDNIIQAYTGDLAGDAPFSYRGRWGTSVPYGENPGSGPDDLSVPNGIAVSGSNAWITEGGNDRIHLYTGVFAATPFTAPTSAGTWGHSPREDGYFVDSGPLATAADGSVFVVDRQKKRIQHFSPRGQLIDAWGESGTAPGQFDSIPSAIAISSTGEVLVSGSIDGIQRFSADGNYLGVITWTQQSPPDANSPGAIEVDGAGNIWVIDWSVRKVLKLDGSGNILASFGGNGFSATDQTFSLPTDLAVSADGLTVFVTDSGTGLVKKFVSTDGATYSFVIASQPNTGSGSGNGFLSSPNSIAIDPISGDVVVADTGNNRVQRFTPDTLNYLGKFGAYGFGDDDLINPVGLAFDQWGNLWLGDPGSDRIKRIGDAPVITLGSVPDTTTAASIAIPYTQTDPAADCDIASGATVPLSIGSNTIVVTCTNAQGSDVESVTIERGTAPSIAISSPVDGSSTTAATTSLTWSAAGTGPIACTVNGAAATSPTAVNLALGANSIAVACTNDFGTDTKSVAVTRTAGASTPPGGGAAQPIFELKLAKKVKLAKKLSFSVRCTVGCTVSAKIVAGGKRYKLKSVTVPSKQTSSRISMRIQKGTVSSLGKALGAKKKVTLTVTVTPPAAYKATQGKTGKAKVAK